MKLIVIVLIDNSITSQKFKQVLLKNLCQYGHTYFVYGNTNKDTENAENAENAENNTSISDISFDETSSILNEYEYKYNLYSDIYLTKQDTFCNMIYKTVNVLEYLYKNNIIKIDTLVLRTNMSTLFDYTRLNKHISNLKNTNIYAGPFIGSFSDKTPMISGTAILIGYNKVKDIIDNKLDLNFKLNEDVALQKIVKLPYDTLNISRIDYLNNNILYHKCFKHDIVYAFRFKSTDRNIDINRMNVLIESNFDTNLLVTSHSNITSEYSLYNKLFEKPIHLTP